MLSKNFDEQAGILISSTQSRDINELRRERNLSCESGFQMFKDFSKALSILRNEFKLGRLWNDMAILP